MSNSFFSPGNYTNITTLGQNMRMREGIARLRSQLIEAEQQLASGKKADTHGGLRAESTLLQELRQKVGRIEGYRSSIGLSQARLGMVQSSLDIVQERVESVRLQSMTAWSPGAAQNIEQARLQAPQHLSAMVSALNTSHGGRYLFSGGEAATPPVASGDEIVNGGNGKIGLKDVIGLRYAADMGPANDGRVSTALGGSVLTVTHDGGPFGMRLTGISQTGGVTITDAQEAAAVAGTTEGTIDIATMTDGDTVTVSFELPDGTSTNITMIASSAAPLPTTEAADTFYFTTGDTAGFEATFDAGVQAIVDREMIGSSAVAAGDDFFDHQAPRIPNGGAGATGYVYAADRVTSWYRAEEAVPTVNGPHADPATLTPTSGQTWLVDDPAVGKWAAHAGELATFNGETWEFTSAEEGSRVIDGNGRMRVYDSATTTWLDNGPAPVQKTARDSVQSKIDDSLYISIGTRANETGPRDALKGAAIMAAATHDPNDLTVYQQAAEKVFLHQNDALHGVLTLKAELGVSEERLDRMDEQHLDTRVVLNEQVIGIEGVDEYELSVRLQEMMTQLEASYQITSRLASLNLTNYL